eukprot:superscaffoldBa00010857_g24928
MESRENRRKYPEHFCEGQHLKLGDLKERFRERNLGNQYLFKEYIPAYPRPEFHVTHLQHDTDRTGLKGIRRDNGFRDPFDPDPEESPRLVWWSLMVRPEDMQSAEKRLLEQIYPDRTEEQVQMQQSFLEKFATSPAFLKSSRLGSYRFTFPLKELLTAYSQQFCLDKQPVMRVYETVLYKQQVMYAVLVHSPANEKLFSKFPLLTDDPKAVCAYRDGHFIWRPEAMCETHSPANEELFSEFPLLTDDPNAVCAYRDGHFIWRPEAMCETHSHELVLRRDEKQVEVMELFGRDREFYVWDNVAVALHMEDGQ